MQACTRQSPCDQTQACSRAMLMLPWSCIQILADAVQRCIAAAEYTEDSVQYSGPRLTWATFRILRPGSALHALQSRKQCVHSKVNFREEQTCLYAVFVSFASSRFFLLNLHAPAQADQCRRSAAPKAGMVLKSCESNAPASSHTAEGCHTGP